jgi:hypothetical protein
VLCDAANTTVQRILEKAGSVEPAFAERYLQAIDTELARQILDYHGREWVNFDPPSDRASFLPNRTRVGGPSRDPLDVDLGRPIGVPLMAKIGATSPFRQASARDRSPPICGS